MKPRAHVVVPVLAAIFSSGAIVGVAATGQKPNAEELKVLRSFSTNFNNSINQAIREPSGARFIAEKCWSSFVDHRIQKIAGSPVCKIETVQKVELRELVNWWLDEVFLGSKPHEEYESVSKASSLDAAWFTQRVGPIGFPTPDARTDKK